METLQQDTNAAAAVLPRRRFSNDEYVRMFERDVLDPSSRVELIDGMIVDMSPAGPRHNHVLTQLTILFAPVFARAVPSVQGTLVVDEGHVYDPDFMLLAPKAGGYRSALPRPRDVLLLIEVAETSLQRDRQVKLPAYAEAGIADYWIADLDQEAIHVHREPRGKAYDQVQTFGPDDRVRLLGIPDFEVHVAQIFA